MPYCEPCGKWRAPNALLVDGTCPRCGTRMEEPELAITPSAGAPEVAPAAAKIPWHFWVMVAAAVIYLGWRAIQGVVWFF